jgi:hypothetical protein
MSCSILGSEDHITISDHNPVVLQLSEELMSPVGIDLVQSSAKREDARLMTSGRANSR